jgi:hypothetical protein
MSGTAALSAARKRRASNAPNPMMMNNNTTPSSFSNTPNPYYNSGAQMNASRHSGGGGGGYPPQSIGPGGINILPPPNMTIYENIDLIKMQMDQRMQLITTQGRNMPPEKLKTLQKQQEIQMQILKQKIELAKEMEMEEEGPHFPSGVSSMGNRKTAQKSEMPAQVAAAKPPLPIIEPKYILEKGVQKLNPKFVDPERISVNPSMNDMNRGNMAGAGAVSQTRQQPQSKQTMLPTATLTPFVSMVSSSGAMPPPVVILKSHDDKIGEHDAVLNDLSNRFNYLHNRIEQLTVTAFKSSTEAKQPEGENANANAKDKSDNPSARENVVDGDNEDESEEPVLFMDEVVGELLSSQEFMHSIVDKIMNDTNLADVICKVEPIIKENKELRSLIHSQQEMLNQMNTMLLSFLNDHGKGQVSNSNSNISATSSVEMNQFNGNECDVDYSGEHFDSNGLCNDYKEADVQHECVYNDDDETKVDAVEPGDVEEYKLDVERFEDGVETEQEVTVTETESKDYDVGALHETPQEDTGVSGGGGGEMNAEEDALDDNSGPSFPDMNRLKLIVSDIVDSGEVVE